MSTLTTQSKVKESIVKDSKSSSESEKRPGDSDDDLLHIVQEFKLKIQVPTTQLIKQLEDWLLVLDKGVILEAIRRTHLNGKTFGYLNAILTDFKQKGVLNYEDIAAYDQSFKYRQQSFIKPVSKRESLPDWASNGYTDVDEPVDEGTNQSIRETLDRIRRNKE